VDRLQPIRPNIYIPSESIHIAAASIAQTLLTADAQAAVTKLLPLVHGNLAEVSNWAQAVRDNPLYEFSEPLHLAYTPFWNCSYLRARDCANNVCVDAAVQNYTQRALNSSLDSDQQTEALMFLIHFAIDANQPLHVGFRRDTDGFALTGRFLGKHTDLHTIWDDSLVEYRINNDFSGDINSWIQSLISEYCSLSPGVTTAWKSCNGFNDPNAACSEVWANEATGVACSSAYMYNGQKLANHFNLDVNYYKATIGTLETQLIKSGVRLANVLNTMFP